MSGTCSDCNQQCTFKDPPKNPGDVFGFPCDWCRLVRCKKCANIGSSEVRAIAAVSRSIPYICKVCAPKLKNLFEVEKRVETLEQQIHEIRHETKKVVDFMDSMRSICDEIKSIKASFSSSFSELKTEITAVKTSLLNTDKQQNPVSDQSSMDTFLTEVNERADRANNIIIYNIPESNSNEIQTRIEDDQQKISDLLAILNKDLAAEKILKVLRLGKKNENRPRPLKVVFSDSRVAKEVLVSGNKMANRHAYKIKNDLTVMQRDCISRVVTELNRRKAEGEENLILKYRNNMPFIAKGIPSGSRGKQKNTN